VLKRIGFIHTVGFLVDDFRARMHRELPGVDCFHILNESLLQDLLRGVPTAMVYRRVVEQIALAADSGADLIVVTCSSTSPAVDVSRHLIAPPILKIDDPMAEKAIATGPRIGLVCTATSTVEPSSALLRAHAAAQGRAISIATTVLPEAYSALMAGNRLQHDAIVRDAAISLAAAVDVVVLAQASLAHLRDDLASTLTIPVLASPPLLMQCLRERCAPQDDTSGR
jgi:Asp/Glu/hydantoin racemase